VLNESYYKELVNKYSDFKDCDRLSDISATIIFQNYSSRNIHFNFPKGYNLNKIINLLYKVFAKEIFKKFSDFPPDTCNKVKKIGGSKKDIFTRRTVQNDKVLLINTIDKSYEITLNYEAFLKNYIPVQQNAQKGVLLNIKKYFSSINEHNFLPTYFSKKLVLIAGQTMWNNLENKNYISSIYLPNSREGESTLLKSIPALEDCLVYVAPKYEVCYETLLKNNIGVDTIIVCDTDLNSLTQIIQDQTKYKFKIIGLSNESEVPKLDNALTWNWLKEEIDAVEHKTTNKIKIVEIKDIQFANLFQNFERARSFVANFEYPIKLANYGYYLRLAFNAIQNDNFDYALYRLQTNKELEKNEGGYTLEFLSDNNPKLALKNLIQYLKGKTHKIQKIKELWEQSNRKLVIVADRQDVDFIKERLKTTHNVFTYTELKKQLKSDTLGSKTLLFYSFDGTKKEFDFIYSLTNNIMFVLYEQEHSLFKKQLQNYKLGIESELTSNNRLALSKIKYEPVAEPTVNISPTLEDIINKLDECSQKAYDNYKDDGDSLLDDVEERVSYQVRLSNGDIVDLESNETVFDFEGKLIKSYRLKLGDKVRIYPREQLAENLFQIAVDVEPEKFGEIGEHSLCWQKILKVCDNVFSCRKSLYNELRKYGLKVLPATVDAYFVGKRKFPMYNSDLHAVCALADNVMPEGNFVEEMFPLLKKSKRLYNSTMIALGRGVKQEIQQFLKDKVIGEILYKKNFTKEALQQFIDEYMPLLTIVKIEEVGNEQ
jgi:hypothetical protein